MSVFDKITDPRKEINKKHDLIDILFLTLSAVISGALDWKEIKEFGDKKLSGYSNLENLKMVSLLMIL